MRFTCDSCQAKYQIADEKVAGKTVRMKCRKCGHSIQVRARRTEAGVEAVPVQPKVPGASAPQPAPGQGPGPPRPGPA
ncbi:MAG: zinc-ribbon domain-containing protein, partial [Deltaproteobacteria bacterium]|nr:zinc-ribbon domain-containing protein [Deltaproteobacteria bacterium]MBW2536147.1 zinc-ribbon domain-containing protein [Deltaproteobacteria bacterium]